MWWEGEVHRLKGLGDLGSLVYGLLPPHSRSLFSAECVAGLPDHGPELIWARRWKGGSVFVWVERLVDTKQLFFYGLLKYLFQANKRYFSSSYLKSNRQES